MRTTRAIFALSLISIFPSDLLAHVNVTRHRRIQKVAGDPKDSVSGGGGSGKPKDPPGGGLGGGSGGGGGSGRCRSCSGCETCRGGRCVSKCQDRKCEICSGNKRCKSRCSKDETCRDGRCVDSGPQCDSKQCLTLQGGRCRSKCKAGETCQNGRCYDSGPQCDQRQCETLQGGRCRSKCKGSETCRNGECFVKPCDSTKCEIRRGDGTCKSRCARGERCRNGVCGGSGGTQQCDSKKCMRLHLGNCVFACSAYDCQTCRNGRCESKCDSRKCQTCDLAECKSRCRQGVETCRNGDCISTVKPCDSKKCESRGQDGKCKSRCRQGTEICSNGVCLEKPCDSRKCERRGQDGKCTSTCSTYACQICRGERCVQKCKSEECERCDAGFCRKKCASDERCDDGNCIPIQVCPRRCPPCHSCDGSTNFQCRNECSRGRGESCVNGRCVSCPSRCPACHYCDSSTNFQCQNKCASDERCEDGICIPIPVCPRCPPCHSCDRSTNFQCRNKCARGESCVNDRCVGCPSRCPACHYCNGSTNFQCRNKCARGESCVNDRCIDVPNVECDSRNCETLQGGVCVFECRGCQHCRNGSCSNSCGQCEVCDGQNCVPKCVGSCQVCRNGRCLPDRSCPFCQPCGENETCVNGECIVQSSECSPTCSECEWCDKDSTGQCIARRTCPCLDCRPLHDCINGICLPRNIPECPPCGDCQKCDPFTGKCVPACPCYPCELDAEYCYIPDSETTSVRSAGSGLDVKQTTPIGGVPSEECGYCLSRKPRQCPPACSYWERCDPVSGQCVPDCNIKPCDLPNRECINGLCIERKECQADCTKTPCRECYLESGYCEPSQICPLCKKCQPNHLCTGQATGGYCTPVFDSRTTACRPAFCGGCGECDSKGRCGRCGIERCQKETMICLKTVDIEPECPSGPKTNMDVMFLFTATAKAFLSENLCNDPAGQEIYLQRYIAERVRETNEALDASCVPTNLRVVHTREIPETAFADWCGSAGCRDETEMARGDTINDAFSLSRLFLGPLDDSSMEALNLKTTDIGDYGADIVAFVYHHSSDWKGGATNLPALMFPLVMNRTCGAGGTVLTENTDKLFELPNQVGFAMVGSKDAANRCSQKEDFLPFEESDCTPRNGLRYSKACASLMKEQVVSLSQSVSARQTKINCGTLLEKANRESWIADEYCDQQMVLVDNAPGGQIELKFNSGVCEWDGGDCCPSTCLDPDTCGKTTDCIDPDVISNNICAV